MSTFGTLDGATCADQIIIVDLQLDDIEDDLLALRGNTDAASVHTAAALRFQQEELTAYRSTTYGGHPPVRAPRYGECQACSNDLIRSAMLKAPCEHHYCQACLEELVQLSMTDATLYPPRCCTQRIPGATLVTKISRGLATAFMQKIEELEDKRPTYCYKPECATYIGARGKSQHIGKCQSCNAKTCLRCRNKSHSGECAVDQGREQVQALATANQWQACPTCRRFVELTIGCNHITCRCKTEFCYVCAALWKTCRCPVWDERRLLRRTQERLVREGADVNNAAVVAVRAHQIQNNHGCNHPNGLNFAPGAGTCDMCQEWLRRYTFECPTCQTSICRRCRDNRR